MSAYHWGDAVAEKSSSIGPLVVGIDPVEGDAPEFLATGDARFLENYSRFVLDAAKGKAAFIKFQAAFFEAYGSAGVVALARSMTHARQNGFSVILDAKRGDIGSTATAYARAYLTPGMSDLEADCMTVNPFLGPDTLEPFFDCARRFGKGVFVLVKTSNQGSGWLQDQMIDGRSVSERLTDLVQQEAVKTLGAGGFGNIGGVIGDTYPQHGAALCQAMPNAVVLAPGLGAQGGKPEDIQTMRGKSKIIILASASRGITKVTDRALSADDYAAFVVEKISFFQNELRKV